MKIQKFAPDTAQVVVGVMSRVDSKIAVKYPGTIAYEHVMEANRHELEQAMRRLRCADGALYASKLYGGRLIEIVHLYELEQLEEDAES